MRPSQTNNETNNNLNMFINPVNHSVSKKSMLGKRKISKQTNGYFCPYSSCSKQFNQKSSLTKHLRSHTGETPYKCQFPNCAKAFTQISNLRRHEKIHTGLKPYKCGICKKGYITKTNLVQHQKVHIMKQNREKFICQHKDCQKSFLHKISLKKHTKKIHQHLKLRRLNSFTGSVNSIESKASNQSIFSKFSFFVKDEMKKLSAQIESKKSTCNTIQNMNKTDISEMSDDQQQFDNFFNSQKKIQGSRPNSLLSFIRKSDIESEVQPELEPEVAKKVQTMPLNQNLINVADDFYRKMSVDYWNLDTEVKDLYEAPKEESEQELDFNNLPMLEIPKQDGLELFELIASQKGFPQDQDQKNSFLEQVPQNFFTIEELF